jgi:hypothetical protein
MVDTSNNGAFLLYLRVSSNMDLLIVACVEIARMGYLYGDIQMRES